MILSESISVPLPNGVEDNVTKLVKLASVKYIKFNVFTKKNCPKTFAKKHKLNSNQLIIFDY